ncbi:MAG: hypothetical protein K1X47_12295 [Cyclobacteriaceae bacterium]|nr:hypothetical protein [Cyclobacteriaceae bacterium]
MKKLLAVAFAGLVLMSCSSLSPAGNWTYSITGTPQGDYTGNMSVAKEKSGYSASLAAEGSSIPFNQFSYDKKASKSNGNFNYQGMMVNLEANVTQEEMNGSVSVQGMTFPFKAIRKK